MITFYPLVFNSEWKASDIQVNIQILLTIAFISYQMWNLYIKLKLSQCAKKMRYIYQLDIK